jgi:hypothetical protein
MAPFDLHRCARGAAAAASIPGAERVLLPLARFAAELRHLDPPVAYRVGLDTGIEFNNVRHALAHPGATRLGTWARILESLDAELFAIESPGLPDDRPDWATWPVPAIRPLAPGALALRRAALGISRRRAAAIAQVGVGTIDDLESGAGLARNLARVSEALGLELAVALARGQGSVGEMWRQCAGRLLAKPAQYARRPGADQPRATMESAAETARRRAEFTASAPSPWGSPMPGSSLPSSSLVARSSGA